MNIRTEVIVTQVSHYDMRDNQGVSVRVVGNYEETNNKFGLSISDAAVPNYNELNNLKRHKRDLPAKFMANISMVTKKMANGKEGQTLALSNLEFVEKMEFVSAKVAVTK